MEFAVTISDCGLRLMTPNRFTLDVAMIRSLLHFEEEKEWKR